MFFGNPELLEKNLHNDLNNLIKNIKIREDQHLTILQYNKNLIQKQRQLDSIAFLNQELHTHRSFLSENMKIHQTLKDQEQEILDKYQFAQSAEPSLIKLMSRVNARILEICQASVDKIKILDEDIIHKLYLMKSSMMRLLNEKPKIDIQQLLEVVILYVQSKSAEEVNRLQEIIKILEEGNIPGLDKVYVPLKKTQSSFSVSPEKKQPKVCLERAKERQKLQKFKESLRNAQKLKQKKAKLASKMLTGLYSTMELSKQQFMEDMVFTHPEDKKKKLYEEILSRNKFNREQILSFEAKKSEYEMKIKEFKEKMELESRRIQSAFELKKFFPEKKTSSKIQEQREEPIMNRRGTETLSQPPESENEIEIVMPERQRLFRRRDKKSPLKPPTPKLSKQAIFTSMQSTQQGFQHLKFDMKNQQIFSRSNRAKLPQISGRSSLDNRYEYKKSQQRQEKKTNAGNLSGGPIKISNGLKDEKKGPRNERQNDIFGGFNALEYTFYVRKKANKFYETKNNFVF